MDNQQAIAQFLLQNLEKETGTVVDLGCGKGDRLKVINDFIDPMAMGIEIFDDYITHCCDRDLLVKHQDISNFLFEIMPASIQCVMIDVLEHLTPKIALHSIGLMQQGKRILIFSPHGDCPQKEYHGNKHQEHHSTWMDEDLTELGFETVVVYDFHQGLSEGASRDVVFARWDDDGEYEGWANFCDWVLGKYHAGRGRKGKR